MWQEILEHFPPGGGNCPHTLLFYYGDIRICGNYKIGINCKICSNSFPIPNIETAIDLKCYNQKQIDEKFEEVIIINSPIDV